MGKIISTRLAALLLLALVSNLAGSPVQTGSGGTNLPARQNSPYVILVSFDGFRADYLRKYGAPNFRRVMREGVSARSLIPAFPSKTFPNHYTLVTGLHPGNHGIVANNFLDPALGRYSMSDREAVREAAWYGGEPIWVTAEKQGMVAAPFFWPGSEAAIGGIRPTFWMPFKDEMTNDERLDTVLSWLRLPLEKRPHLLTLYFSDVDNAGHKYGPDSAEVAEAVRRVDRVLGRLFDAIRSPELAGKVYLVLVSDHGMAAYRPEQYLALDGLVDLSGVEVADSGPFVNLHTGGDAARARRLKFELNRKLRHGRAYLRAEVPARLRYSRSRRVGDVVVLMRVPYQAGPGSRRPESPGGAHGWDPATPSMHGIFLAWGPRVKRGAVVPAFSNVEVYPFLAELLGLEPARPIDGHPRRLYRLVMRRER